MTEQVASHSENVQEQGKPSQEVVDSILREQFGIDTTKKEDAPEPNLDHSGDEEEVEDEKTPEPPATEEPKKLKLNVKINKQQKEVEVEESELPSIYEKAWALDKERERKSEYEKALQRAAKLAGFDNAEDYLANLDKIEKESAKKQQDQFEQMKQQMREEAENAGMDPDKIEQYLDNHPVLVQAKQIIERDQQNQALQQQQEAQNQYVEGWTKLFEKYPKLAETISEDGTEAPWMTDELVGRINRGYDPVDAYELVYRDEILAEERKKHEQNLLKQQRLNKRAKVEGTVPVEEDDDPNLPQVQAAFAAFGLDPKQAKKFITKK